MISFRKLRNETKELSVLFVEDHDFLRLEMKEVLEEFFKYVAVASNGKMALDLYQARLEENKNFDLVISDIQMPVMDGVLLSKKIKDFNNTQPIIILSGHSDSRYLIELINIGVSKFLTKPIVQDELFSVLHDEAKKINNTKHKVQTESSIVHLSDGYVWDTDKLILMHKNTPITLTKHELVLLIFFVSKNNYICTTEEIIEVFNMNSIEMNEKNIRNLVFKLRKKIPEKCVSSVYGLGYKFTLV
jgi:DNA-binding response OmpR family regulator